MQMSTEKICQCASGSSELEANNWDSLDERPIRKGCYLEDNWSWDPSNKSWEVVLYGPDHRTALFHPGWSNGTAAVRGTKPLNGLCTYWELEVSHRIFGTSISFGIGTESAPLHADSFQNLIGANDSSWGLSHKGLVWHAGENWSYTDHFRENVPTTVGILFDGITGTLKFYRDRKDLGVAFKGLHLIEEPLYPMVSSTVARSEIRLGMRRTLHSSLQEQCLTVIAHALPRHPDTSTIPLPSTLKSRLDAKLSMRI